MKRIFNIFHALLQLAALVMLHTQPLAVYWEETHYNVYGTLIQGSTGGISYEQMMEGMPILGIIATGLLVCGIVICFVSAIRKSTERDGVIHSILPIFIFLFNWIFVAWLGLYNVDGVAGSYVDSHYTQTTMMPIWNIIQIMLLVSIVLGFVKRSKAFAPRKETAPVQVTNSTPEINTARELKMYKELLDEGTITQEEFDAKKKQLLGL